PGTAAAVQPVAERSDASAVDGGGWRTGIPVAAPTLGYRGAGQAQDSVHPALGPQSLRRAGEGEAEEGHDPRPGAWQASSRRRGGLGTFQWGCAGTRARRCVRAAQGRAVGFHSTIDREDGGPVAVARPLAVAVAGAAGLRRGRAV